MIANVKPFWIQNVGFWLIVLFGSSSINGMILAFGLGNFTVAPWLKTPIGLSIYWFLFGVGLAMQIVPRIIVKNGSAIK